MTAGAGVMLGGPVAGLVLGAYGAVGAVSWRAWRARQRADRARQQSIEAIADMAADLRAGLAVPAVARVPDDAATARVAAARQISERLGAPLADLLDRIEIDLRGQRRVRAEVAAQTAGARATIVLLAVMPFGGVFLGTSLGTDPLHQLLHTRPGAGCATVALVLQGCGLLVASRLVRAGATGLDG
ncbi:MAG: hypothetical protein HKP61_19260 [Dactylosporangium sp.]|nr:type II secretion system F family protein [Dactylosporangium sp.]NNJ63029.1 hypothetical protein [Dactylosporangium sp.]